LSIAFCEYVTFTVKPAGAAAGGAGFAF
jgi:hypothetical protein